MAPASADPEDDSEALAQLIDGSVLAGLDADALTELLAGVTTSSGNPSDPGPNAADIDLSALGDSLTVDIGSVSLPLIGDGTNGGLLNLGDGAAAGLLNGYASSPTGDQSLSASGAVGADGSINADPGTGTDTASLDLTGLTDQLELDALTDQIVDQVALDLGEPATNGDRTGEPATAASPAHAGDQDHTRAPAPAESETMVR